MEGNLKIDKILVVIFIVILLQGCKEYEEPIAGKLQLLLVEFYSGAIVKDRVVQILDKNNEVIDEGFTNLEGEVIFSGILQSSEYKIRVINSKSGSVVPSHDTEWFTYDSKENTKRVETYMLGEYPTIAVPIILQQPTLPNGCEITSLTAVFNYYGYNYTKEELSDTHLEKQEFEFQDGKYYNDHPSEKFIGNPRDNLMGKYVFVEQIVKTADKVISENDLPLTTVDLKNAHLNELESYLQNGIPIVIWVTLDLNSPKKSGGWYLKDSGEFYEQYVNLHAVVIIGQTVKKFIIMDPLKGIVEYSKEAVYKSYLDLGSQAMTMIK